MKTVMARYCTYINLLVVAHSFTGGVADWLAHGAGTVEALEALFADWKEGKTTLRSTHGKDASRQAVARGALRSVSSP